MQKKTVRKIVFMTLTIAISSFLICSSYALGATEIIIADINNDSIVNVADVVLMKKHLEGIELLTAEQLTRADVNDDGIVDDRDLGIVLMFALEIGDFNSMPISSIDAINITVSHGTEYKDIRFPNKIRVKLYDGTTREMNVKWEGVSKPLYNPNQPNSYNFSGLLADLPSGITNPNKLFARAIVIVSAKANISAAASVYN